MTAPDYTPEQKAGLAAVAREQKKAEGALKARDELIVEWHAKNVRPSDLAARAGLTRGRVHQIIQRHRESA